MDGLRHNTHTRLSISYTGISYIIVHLISFHPDTDRGEISTISAPVKEIQHNLLHYSYLPKLECGNCNVALQSLLRVEEKIQKIRWTDPWGRVRPLF